MEIRKQKRIELKKKEETIGIYVALGMSLGICLGCALGLLFGNIAVGIPIGICLGMSIGLAIGSYKKNQKTKLENASKKEQISRGN